MLGHLALDLLDRDFAIRRTQDVGKAILRQVKRDFAAHKACKSKQPGQRAFQHADIGGNAMRKEFQNSIANSLIGFPSSPLSGISNQNSF